MPYLLKTHAQRTHNARLAEKESDERRGTAYDRGYDRQWEKVRMMHLRRNPLCADCGRAAEEVHHAVRLRCDKGKRLTMDNLTSLCKSCHSKRTAKGE